MHPVRSLKQLLGVIKTDWRMRRAGLPFGWFTKHFYRLRWHQRNNLPSPTLDGIAKVRGSDVHFHITLEQLGVLYSVYVEEEYDLTQYLKQPPATILDLGANIGLASTYLHIHYPQARQACIEPDPRNLPTLTRMFDKNQVPAKVLPCAISDKPGTFNLMIGRDSTMSALEGSTIRSSAESVPVTVRTMPDILAELQWDRVDLLKIDIEGSEDDLLSKDNGWLKHIQAIVIEIHPNTSKEKIDQYLKPYGFAPLVSLEKVSEPVFFTSK
jgi:FkbM family methyltransferase